MGEYNISPLALSLHNWECCRPPPIRYKQTCDFPGPIPQEIAQLERRCSLQALMTTNLLINLQLCMRWPEGQPLCRACMLWTSPEILLVLLDIQKDIAKEM